MIECVKIIVAMGKKYRYEQLAQSTLTLLRHYYKKEKLSDCIAIDLNQQTYTYIAYFNKYIQVFTKD
jgi:hypothetical protein